MAGHKKGYYVRIRRNPSWEQVGEIGPFTTETVALSQAKNMPSPAPGFVINVEADSAKVRGARKIGNSRKAGAIVSNPRRNPARRTVTPKAPDTIAADDLVLFAETTYALYGTKQSIVADLVKKWKKGTYDEHKAAKLWLHWFDEAARAYNREFGRGNTMAGFDKPTREYAAASMARGTTIAFSSGNFAEVYPA